jgi:hypothetical protein
MNPVEMNILELASADEQVRVLKINEAWNCYLGQIAKPLRVRANQPDDNVIVNFARLVVNKAVSFLFGEGVSFALDSDQEIDPREEWLNQCWRRNHQASMLKKLAQNGAISGHAYIKIIPGIPFPRFVVLDSQNVTAIWKADDIETVEKYTVSFPTILDGAPAAYRQVIEQDTTATWKMTQQMKRTLDREWTTTSIEIWPHQWAPIIDCQNLPLANSFYGLADLNDDTLPLMNSINFTLSNIQKIIRYHAHPRTWGKSIMANELSSGPDEVMLFPSPDAELHNLEMSGDLGSSIAFYERLKELFFALARIPEVSIGKLDNAGALSGVALKILYEPLIELTQDKRTSYEEMLIELNRRALDLGGYGNENVGIVNWPELTPTDPKSDAETALLDQQLGASKRTLLAKRGYDPDVEESNCSTEAEAVGAGLLQFGQIRPDEVVGNVPQ